MPGKPCPGPARCPGAVQTEIRVGQIGVSRTHPEYTTVDLLMRIFGGEGANRLFGVLRGDRGLTYSAELPKGSEVVAGEWWPADYKGPPLISLEAEVAATLGLKVGDSMTVSLLGVEVPAKIASLRTVKWDNFGLNYVIVFSPGSLDAAPHNMVATLTVSKPAEAVLAKALPPVFPSASLIEVGEVTAQITTLLSQMAQAIAAAASIAILAGIAVLVGAIAAARQSRIYDSVIMKMLGSSRCQILGTEALEYGVLPPGPGAGRWAGGGAPCGGASPRTPGGPAPRSVPRSAWPTCSSRSTTAMGSCRSSAGSWSWAAGSTAQARTTTCSIDRESG